MSEKVCRLEEVLDGIMRNYDEFAKKNYWGSCMECCDYEGKLEKDKQFIRKAVEDAILSISNKSE